MPSRRRASSPVPRRRLLIYISAVFVVLAAAAVGLDRLTEAGPDEGSGVPSNPAGPVTGLPPVAAALPSPPPEPPVVSGLGEAPPVLSLPGDFPDSGPGTFAFAGGEGDVLGDSGPLRRFRVAVEDGIDEDPDEFAAFVADTLGHPQGWTAGGEQRLQRVPGGSGHEFTVYLVTSRTAERMCAAVGLDVVGGQLPEGGVSCRTPGQVVLNLARWRLSVPHYVAAGEPLDVYRRMLVNHEVGHQLGHGHEECPGGGEPAPVMQQQTIDLDGCEANPWPYRDGSRYTGRQVP